MNAEQELAAVFDGLVDDAVSVLAERLGRPKAVLHDEFDGRAFGYLVVDFEHSGKVTLTARALANLLAPPPTVLDEPAAHYAAADERRKARKPVGWLEPDVFQRSIGRARQALQESKPADRGSA